MDPPKKFRSPLLSNFPFTNIATVDDHNVICNNGDLSKLPIEVFARVLSYLDMKEIIQLRQCQRRNYTIINKHYLKPLQKKTRRLMLEIASVPLEAPSIYHELTSVKGKENSLFFNSLIERDTRVFAEIRKKNAENRDRLHSEEQKRSYLEKLDDYGHKVHSVITYYKSV